MHFRTHKSAEIFKKVVYTTTKSWFGHKCRRGYDFNYMCNQSLQRKIAKWKYILTDTDV